MKVGVIFGSASDAPIMKKVTDTLADYGVEYIPAIISAHRMPEFLKKKIMEMEDSGVEVFVAGAGLAAHLPGVIASHTVKPVIGVPVSAALNGEDALLSIVQMPPGIPVACVGIDRGRNAAILAVQMLAVKEPVLRARLIESREEKKKAIMAENERIEELLK
ncbi:MAG TPA: 5-(carboxyamino)imidazole ribonucleotide mutase [Thermotogota bacterium]|nr:5-(carboxyamino)imidazole ribonucleotide mutase [Thermotogota bacterium]HPJ88956.1 5-(carboxyamino)imidazole ribonucleotide mutase [Thermotogota bacterium]HPR95906.1 5-(carboxyamino)imidazole ribonucleotide mutase [Thermotogota bacterium]